MKQVYQPMLQWRRFEGIFIFEKCFQNFLGLEILDIFLGLRFFLKFQILETLSFCFARIYDLIQRTNHTLHVIKEIGCELMDVVRDIHVIITQRWENFIVTCIALVGPVFAVLKNILG